MRIFTYRKIYRSSVPLLNGREVKLEDISKYVLEPALYSKEERVRETLVIVLSRLSCYLSGCADFVR